MVWRKHQVRSSELVLHNEIIARKLAEIATLEDFPEGKQLYVQGEPGNNFLYFVLSGSFDLSVQDKDEPFATVASGQAVGEFPIVNPSLNYTITVLAKEQSVIARVSEKQFLSIAEDYPEIWKNMAKMLVTRLKEKHERPCEEITNLKRIKPGDLTIGELLSGIPAKQLWATIVAAVGAFTAVATVAYNIGSGNW
jgi:CRP-like cAMP-binding protein